MDKQELQQKYMQFQMLQQQAAKVQKQTQAIEQQLMELITIEEGLADIEKTEEGTEILVPISAGIFLKAKLTDGKKVILNSGSNVAVEKSIPDTIALLKNQSQDLMKVQEQLLTDLTKMDLQIKMLQQEIMKEQ